MDNEKQRSPQNKLALSYQKCFDSNDGKPVYEDLEKKFGQTEAVLSPKDSMGRTDPYEICRNEGKRIVICYIIAMLNKNINQDRQEEAINIRE